MSISKQEFCELLRRWQRQDDDAQAVNSILRRSDSFANARDFFDMYALLAEGRADAIKLLSLCMKDDGGWIEYFIFELDYGRKWDNYMICDENGSPIDLSDADKLYDFLANASE